MISYILIISYTYRPPQLTLVVLFLHLSDPAKTFSVVELGGRGHWSISTLLRSTSMPLVPLGYDKNNVQIMVTQCLNNVYIMLK